MKHFLKGAAVVAAVTIVNMIVNVFCNTRGIELNSTAVTMVSTFCGLAIYQALLKNENNTDKKD